MFDRFMELTLPFWLVLSALFALGTGLLLVQAAFRLRHLRALLDEAALRRTPVEASPQRAWQDGQDWVPAP